MRKRILLAGFFFYGAVDKESSDEVFFTRIN